MAAAVTVFISYAHEDADLKDQLLQHLAGLVNDGLIRVWHDRDIQAGDYWINSIDNALEISSVVLLLISPSFLASSYCYGSELRRALRRASAGEARVIPIILRPSDWRTKELGGLQALPRDGRAVTSWSNRDEGFLDVIEGLRSVIAQLNFAPDPLVVETGMPTGEVRYFLYISDAKVDMLLPQFAAGSDITSGNSMPRTDSGRIQRLNTVLRHVERHGRIGSVDEPADYVYGVHDLYWGHFHGSISEREKAPTRPVIAFCGRTSKTTLLMCGRTKHLVGSQIPEEPGFSSSHVPYLLDVLSKAVELEGASPDSIARRPSRTSEEDELPKRGRELAIELIANARSCVSGVEQRLEFLAKPLLSGLGTRRGGRCLMASPLYVALSLLPGSLSEDL